MKLRIKNKYNEDLVGILKKASNNGIVILVHGFMASKEFSLFKEIADKLYKYNISSFRFDFSGTGESQGSFEESIYSKKIDDLLSVIDYFYSKGYKKIGLIGHSLGAGVCLSVARKTRKVSFVVSLAGAYKLKKSKKGLSKRFKIRKSLRKGIIEIYNAKLKKWFKINLRLYLKDVKKYNIIEDIEKLKIPLMFVHSKDDEIVNFDEFLKASSKAMNARVFIVSKLNHNFKGNNEFRKKVIQEVADFVFLNFC